MLGMLVTVHLEGTKLKKARLLTLPPFDLKANKTTIVCHLLLYLSHVPFGIPVGIEPMQDRRPLHRNSAAHLISDLRLNNSEKPRRYKRRDIKEGINEGF